MTRASCIYGQVPRGPHRHPGQPCRPRWQARLPERWRAEAIAPASFRVYREYEVPARRVVGEDSAGEPCFCAYDYRLTDLRSDDDEELYCALAYEETVRAWRLRDGRWLVHRYRLPFGEDGEAIADLGFQTQMPR